MNRYLLKRFQNLAAKLRGRGIPSTANDFGFYRLKNIHQGKRAFVIGNGPSLRISDLERLKGEITLASNKIYLAFDQTSWRPTYHFVEDQVVFEQGLGILRKQKHQMIIRGFYAGFREEVPGALRYRMEVETETLEPRFEFRPVARVFCGFTVLYSALQMARYMGIEKIYLLGVDQNYVKENIVGQAGLLELCRQGETSSHFHPDYYKAGDVWQFPDVERQRAAFKKAGEVFLADGRQILNASRGGNLELFPRVEFDSLF